MVEEFKRHILDNVGKLGRVYTTCPACSVERSSSASRNKKVLGVNYEQDQAVYYCNHCGETGHVFLSAGDSIDWGDSVATGDSVDQLPEYPSLGKSEFEYLMSRGIESQELDLFAADKSFSVGDGWQTLPAIGYPYHMDRNVKWIAPNPLGGKKLVAWERTGGGAGLYRRESIDWADQALVICEGELDCESARWIGFNAISVPNGAPKGSQVERIFKSITTKIQSFQRVVLAMDDDEAGQSALDSLVDLVGRKRAHTVRYPAGCKDVNDILVRFGQDGLRSALTNTQPCLNGIVVPSSYSLAVNKLRTEGFAEGSKTGITPLDELIEWHPGMLAVCSGVPGSGKSELNDEIMVRLAEDGWSWAVFSPENTGELHLAKLAAKRLRKPVIGDNVLATDEEVDEATRWVDERFLFLSADGGTSIKSLLDRAEACKHKLRSERFGLIIDPWNFVTGDKEGSETEQINELLAEIKKWANRPDLKCLVIIVAHPTKQPEGFDQRSIGGYQISGSAHWFNRADVGYSVSANREELTTAVNVWKIRFQPWHGTQGTATLSFDPNTGTYGSAFGDAESLDVNWEFLEAMEADRESQSELERQSWTAQKKGDPKDEPDPQQILGEILSTR